MRTNCMKCVGTIIGFCCVLLIGAILHAQAPTNYRWSEPSGNWGDAMWTDADGAIAGTFTPGEGDTDTFTVDGTVSMNWDALTGIKHGQTVTISNGGKIIGVDGADPINGQWVINGAIESTNHLYFGSANIEINEGGALSAREFRIGNQGENGALVQNGGAVATTAWLTISEGGTSGSYTMKGGTLTVGIPEQSDYNFAVGVNHHGVFELDGENAVATIYADDMSLGWNAQGTGTANLKSGTLNATNNFRVRTEGSQLQVSGATLNVGNNLDFWGDGTVYVQTAGTVNVKNVDFGQPGTANMVLSGGQLNIAANLWGQDASRTFFDWNGGTLGTCQIGENLGYWWGEGSLTFRIGTKGSGSSPQTINVGTIQVTNDNGELENRNLEVGIHSLIKDADGVTAETASQIVKTGNGILILTNENTFQGGLRIEGGMVRAEKDTSLGTGDIVLADGGIHNSDSSPEISNNIIIETGKTGYFQAGWGKPLTIKGNITAKGNIGIHGDGGQVWFDGNTISTAEDGNDTISVHWNSIAIKNTVTANVGDGKVIDWQNDIVGDGTLRKTGAGRMTIGGQNNSFTGGSRIEGGIVWISKDTGLGTGDVVLSDGGLQNNDSALTISNNILIETGKTGYFQAGWGKPLTIKGNITAKGNIHVNGDSGQVWFDGNTISTAEDGNDVISINGDHPIYINTAVTTDVGAGKTVVWENNILGTGSLTKIGAGTLQLTGANEFSGGLFINEGIVSVTNQTNLGAGRIVVAPDGTLRVTENFSSDDIDLEINGTWEIITSLNDYGTIHARNIRFSEDAHLMFTFDEDYTPTLGDRFAIATATGGITQSSPFPWSSMLAEDDQEDWMLFVKGNSLILFRGDENSIPEPSTWVLLAFGLAGIVWLKRPIKPVKEGTKCPY